MAFVSNYPRTITHTSLVFYQEERLRRSYLVSKLTQAQRDEFTDIFKLIDYSGDGKISVAELKRMLESVGEENSETELRDMINKADASKDGNEDITLEDLHNMSEQRHLLSAMMTPAAPAFCAFRTCYGTKLKKR